MGGGFDRPLAEGIRLDDEKFINDRDCQAWEPGGDEFLSPALIEALCMARCCPQEEFAAWFAGFLPRTYNLEPATLFTPPPSATAATARSPISTGLNLGSRLVLAFHRAAPAGTGAPSRPGRGRRASCGRAAACCRRLYGRALAGELRVAGHAGGQRRLIAMLGCPPDILCLAMVPAEGLEPPTGLQNRCSTN